MCPYNPCHYFRLDQIEAHILVCGDKSKFDLCDDWDSLAMRDNDHRLSDDEEPHNTSIISTRPTIRSKPNSEKRAFENFLLDDF